ncbi:hypothetical protein [Aliiroseovarius sp. YM-037]|uniref:hypothetical protein n=1 Tax=Aliiroseovarius sp. YM-037 TaxID=3341728 RepID=UPI003A803D50
MSVLTLSSLVDIRDNYVSYGGNKYFRTNVYRVKPRSHRRERTPLARASRPLFAELER